MAGRVLIVDDDAAMCEMLRGALLRRGFDASFRSTPAEALEALEAEPWDVVITDLNMRGMSGIDLCQRVAQTRADVPVIVVTAFGSLESAIAAIRAGAWDYVTKPFEMDAIAVAIERAIKHRSLSREVRELREVVERNQKQEDMIGGSASIRRVTDLVERVANTDATVLIMGESGTGKELVARALHARSHRESGPFIAVNCAAMPEALLESELFGHAKGAFTDAKAARTGLFVQASGGTLFLDEIGEMPLEMQPKLLRALQERSVRPVGGTQEVPFDVRLVAATNRDLETDVEERRFREDLFYRVNVVRIDVPPLRARGHDVLLLAQHFVTRFSQRSRKTVAGLSNAAAEKLLSYDWPGNVRELENCIECAVALTRCEQIAVDDLPHRIREHRISPLATPTEEPLELVSMDEIERRYIARVLQAVSGNKSQAATVLGFDRRTLYRKLERYGLSTHEIARRPSHPPPHAPQTSSRTPA
jgi:two-component system response regulator HydG